MLKAIFTLAFKGAGARVKRSEVIAPGAIDNPFTQLLVSVPSVALKATIDDFKKVTVEKLASPAEAVKVF